MQHAGGARSGLTSRWNVSVRCRHSHLKVCSPRRFVVEHFVQKALWMEAGLEAVEFPYQISGRMWFHCGGP